MGLFKLDKGVWDAKMKECETVKDPNKLLGIVNNVKLCEKEFLEFRLIQKIMVTVSERYETSITSLENTKDLSIITLTKVIHAL